jgi:hypothetical protein
LIERWRAGAGAGMGLSLVASLLEARLLQYSTSIILAPQGQSGAKMMLIHFPHSCFWAMSEILEVESTST